MTGRPRGTPLKVRDINLSGRDAAGEINRRFGRAARTADVYRSRARKRPENGGAWLDRNGNVPRAYELAR